MAGWYLGLVSRASASSSSSSTTAVEQEQVGRQKKVHVIINQDPVRAAVWSTTDEMDGGAGGRYIRIPWGSSSSSGKEGEAEEYRYLTEGARDARAPNVRLVVLGGEAHRRAWNFSK